MEKRAKVVNSRRNSVIFMGVPGGASTGILVPVAGSLGLCVWEKGKGAALRRAALRRAALLRASLLRAALMQ